MQVKHYKIILLTWNDSKVHCSLIPHKYLRYLLTEAQHYTMVSTSYGSDEAR